MKLLLSSIVLVTLTVFAQSSVNNESNLRVLKSSKGFKTPKSVKSVKVEKSKVGKAAKSEKVAKADESKSAKAKGGDADPCSVCNESDKNIKQFGVSDECYNEVGYWIEQKRLDEPEECEGTENESASTVSAECKKTVFSMLNCSMSPP